MNRRTFLKSFSCAIGGLAVGLPIIDMCKKPVSNTNALERINLKRVCLTIQKDITNLLFNIIPMEYNDSVTREKCRISVNSYLDHLKKLKAFYNYNIICDERNNTSDVIYNHEFKLEVLLQFKKSVSMNHTSLLFTVNC